MKITDKVKNCWACNQTDVSKTPFIEGWGHKLFDDLQIQVCASCGFGSVINELSGESLDAYYDEVYRSSSSPMYFNFAQQRPNQLEMRAYAQMLLAKPFINSGLPINILDVGAGPGGSYHAAREIFPNSKMFFLDNNIEIITYYKKWFDVTVLEDLTTVDEKFDLILMSHSLEHFSANGMRGLLENLRQCLTENGRLVVEVPHCDFRIASHLDGIERVNDTPHLQFFSIDSLVNIVSSSKGLSIEFVDSVGRILNSRMPNDMPELRRASKLSRVGHDHSIVKFRLKGFMKNTAKFFLDKLYLSGIAFKIYHFIIKNAFEHDEFNYGGDRSAIRAVIQKSEHVK